MEGSENGAMKILCYNDGARAMWLIEMIACVLLCFPSQLVLVFRGNVLQCVCSSTG